MTALAAPKFDYMPACDEHAPDLYKPDGLADTLSGLEAIGPAELARYEEDGFLAVEGAFTPEETAAASAGLNHLMSGGNPAFGGLMFENAVRDRFDRLAPDERFDAVRKLFDFVAFDTRLATLAAHPRLLAAVSSLMGGRMPRMFQDMALVKPPRIGREKPWHQDNAYFNYAPGTPVVGVWIALDAATTANGCMHLWRGGHREGARLHFRKRDWQICDRDMLEQRKTVLAAPLQPGGALLFSGMLPHGTPTNHSPLRRRALQFHYAPADAEKVPEAERLKLFGSEGKNVTC